MNDDEKLRLERVCIGYGKTLGQLSELLNNITILTNDQIYKSLLDISMAGALHLHEIYYKDKKE